MAIQAPTKQEIQLAIQKLNNKKAPGIDGISAELRKPRGVEVINKIHKFVGIMWEKERIPEEYYMLNPSEGGQVNCQNYSYYVQLTKLSPPF
jgi:hypothetical protein